MADKASLGGLGMVRSVVADGVSRGALGSVMDELGMADWVSQGKVCLRMARQMRKGALSHGSVRFGKADMDYQGLCLEDYNRERFGVHPPYCSICNCMIEQGEEWEEDFDLQFHSQCLEERCDATQ